jgi:hypothetical protein
MRTRWLSRRALLLHFLVVTLAPGCLFAGWWQVHRALSGNLLSYFYSVEWPIFSILAIVAWWQLLHDERSEGDFERPRSTKGSFLHRDEEVPSKPLVWDTALETPELAAYNDYLKALSDGRGRKTWRNPLGLPPKGAGEAGSGESSLGPPPRTALP